MDTLVFTHEKETSEGVQAIGGNAGILVQDAERRLRVEKANFERLRTDAARTHEIVRSPLHWLLVRSSERSPLLNVSVAYRVARSRAEGRQFNGSPCNNQAREGRYVVHYRYDHICQFQLVASSLARYLRLC